MRKLEDLVGKKFGHWTVLHRTTGTRWQCRCDCGKEVGVSNAALLSGESIKCRNCERGIIDLTGMQFNFWKVLHKTANRRWKCQCGCGRVLSVKTVDLISGKSLSCNRCKREELDKFLKSTSPGEPIKPTRRKRTKKVKPPRPVIMEELQDRVNKNREL